LTVKKEVKMKKENPIVMVVEDERLLLQAIAKKLKMNEMEVIPCLSGKKAFDYLKSLSKLPDVIWLDYYLKDMDGLGFMNRLKENSKWKKIPVVVVSNSASPKKVHNMLALGVKKYFLKAEYRLDDLVRIIREFISKEGSRGGEK